MWPCVYGPNHSHACIQLYHTPAYIEQTYKIAITKYISLQMGMRMYGLILKLNNCIRTELNVRCIRHLTFNSVQTYLENPSCEEIFNKYNKKCL